MISTPNSIKQMQVIPTGGPLGAEVQGIDLTQPLPEDAIQELHQALLSHCVLLFRRQHISDEDQVRFTNYFGQAVEHVRKQLPRPVKEIFFVSNVEKDGQPIGALGNDEIPFHSDLSYLRKPGTLSIIYAVELPSTGGATQWCNCYAAYEGLDTDLKARLRGMRAVHRHHVESQNPPELIDHPVVCTHPDTGRKALYVGPHLTRHIVGVSESESRKLLGTLFDHMSQERFCLDARLGSWRPDYMGQPVYHASASGIPTD